MLGSDFCQRLQIPRWYAHRSLPAPRRGWRNSKFSPAVPTAVDSTFAIARDTPTPPIVEFACRNTGRALVVKQRGVLRVTKYGHSTMGGHERRPDRSCSPRRLRNAMETAQSEAGPALRPTACGFAFRLATPHHSRCCLGECAAGDSQLDGELVDEVVTSRPRAPGASLCRRASTRPWPS